MGFFRVLLAVGVFFALVATTDIPAHASAAVIVAADSSAASAGATSAGCNQLATTDVVYLEKVSYRVVSYRVDGGYESKVYVLDNSGKGMSLKEFIERHLPGAKVLCINPNSYNRKFFIWYTK